MSLHTTFRVGGPADLYAEPETAEEVRELIAEARERGMPCFLMGRGSNLLVGDGGYRGMVICFGKGFSRVKSSGGIVEAQAGATLGAAAACALESGLEGMEFAAGIPGSVGGALVMNAGAYGGEMRDILLDADLLLPTGETARISAEELELGYRSSNIERLGRVVLGARFRLRPGKREEIDEKMRDFNRRRREKQPLEFASAGSTFKRPGGSFAGLLIQEAGCKGLRVGGAEVSEKHAGFLINRGDATAREIKELIAEVQRRVFEGAGVRLEPEVKFLGEFS